jgi:DNA-binding response OmpR family regulator
VGKQLCILLVDEHDDSLSALARLLSRNGYSILQARTVWEARELAAANRCDLVIADIHYPDGSGLDLMRELRQRHGLKGIAVTRHAGKEDVRDALSAGFVTHLGKPAAYSELLAAVEDVVGRPPSANGGAGLSAPT